MSQPIKILAFYRGTLDSARGTPIRVRSIMSRLAKDPAFDYSVASWDTEAPTFVAPGHFLHLNNTHFSELNEMVRYVRKNNIQIIIGHTIASAYYLIALRLFTKCKIVLEMHGFAEEESKEYGEIGTLQYWWQKIIFNLAYSSCHLITTCSPSASKFLEKPGRKVATIYGGVDTEIFKPSLNHSVNSNEIVIGYAGNSRRWQGLDFLITAYQKLRETHPEFKLKLLLSERKGLAGLPLENIEIFGPVVPTEVPAFLNGCDILVIPRPDTWVTRISFPSKLPEYLAMGKVVVASDRGDANTVIVSGKNGFLYQPGDQAEFLQCLVALVDPVIRKEIGEAALVTVKEFSWEHQVAIFAEALKKIF